MTKEELVEKLKGDLKNEMKHLSYYLMSAAVVRGLHRVAVREFLLGQAAEEFEHVKKFSDLIVGLGGVPDLTPNPYPTLTSPKEILQYALEIEEEVLVNYHVRLAESEEMGREDGRWVVIFLEDQIEDSRQDADNLRQMCNLDE